MTITNGYCTLNALKARLLELRTYTASTLSFTLATSTIADTAFGLRGLAEGNVITVTGSVGNDGTYTVASVDSTGASITTTQALVNEAAGASVTLRMAGNVFNDTELENCIEAASRAIDSYCKRRIYAAAETRYYSPRLPDWLEVDDLLTVTTLKTDEDGDRTYETTWAVTDYDLMPTNAALRGRPYTMIQTTPNGNYSFPVGVKSVQIAGSFGYAGTTPDAVNEACLLLSTRLFKRKDAPFGIMGSPELGELRNLRADDPDLITLLKGIRKVGA
jgi:hypothetical protein